MSNSQKESVARISKTMNLPKSQFVNKIGLAEDEDFENILGRYIEYIELNANID